MQTLKQKEPIYKKYNNTMKIEDANHPFIYLI